MIPRLRLAKNRPTAKSIWPPSEDKQTPLFTGRHPLRKLVVLADWTALEPLDRSAWCRGRLLADLLWNRHVVRLRYADTGPPAEIERKTSLDGEEYVPGWAILSDPSPTPCMPWGIREVVYAHRDFSGCHGIFNNRHEVAAGDRATIAYRDRDEAGAAAQRAADALAAMVAETLGADLFITDREYLHNVTRDISDGVTICRPDDALALVGLYLRSQGEYVVHQYPNGTFSVNKGLYYLVAVYELLTSVWRWLAGCAQHSRGGGEEALMFLGGSLLERVSRALQDRDGVHIALNKPQNNDTADEALAALDAVLLWLMGAVDVTARVAHHVLGVSGSPREAGWRPNSKLLKAAATNAPGLAAIVEPGTDGEAVLNVLRLLRNSVHGEALQPIGVIGPDSERDGTLMALPRDDQNELREAFAALGGEAEWGVRLPVVDQTRVDPGVLLENLLPRVLRLLNEIMDETPVERLSHVKIRDSDKSPPTTAETPYTEQNRQSIAWQLGF